MTKEQIALRFPQGTRARLLALSQPHESLTATLLRAITALEQQPQEQPQTATEQRLTAIEQRLDTIEQQQPHKATQSDLEASRASQTVGQNDLEASRQQPQRNRTRADQYPPEIRQQAVQMKQQGHSNKAIIAAIQEQLGRSPSGSNINKLLRIWQQEEKTPYQDELTER